MGVQEYFNSVLGRGIDFDGAYGFQCVDLIEDYIKKCFGLSPIAGNAINIFDNADPSQFEKITNTRSNFPRLGDIVCWDSGIGQYGHVAICNGNADPFTFESIDQNFPLGTVVHYQKHNYFAVKGWLRPKVLVEQPQPAPVSSPFPAVYRVDKDLAMVRTAPYSTAALGGTQRLYRGNEFVVVAVVEGENVSGNNKWLKSQFGNYVWSGNVNRK